MQNNLNTNENIIKEDFKVQIKKLTDFYSVLNEKYQFQGCEKSELLDKLKKL